MDGPDRAVPEFDIREEPLVSPQEPAGQVGAKREGYGVDGSSLTST